MPANSTHGTATGSRVGCNIDLMSANTDWQCAPTNAAHAPEVTQPEHDRDQSAAGHPSDRPDVVADDKCATALNYLRMDDKEDLVVINARLVAQLERFTATLAQLASEKVLLVAQNIEFAAVANFADRSVYLADENEHLDCMRLDDENERRNIDLATMQYEANFAAAAKLDAAKRLRHRRRPSSTCWLARGRQAELVSLRTDIPLVMAFLSLYFCHRSSLS
ncbi:hypothetical protein CspeluHIS016_0109990 [Cutaneotrichosporon spelunceum]|uniref:Uncharacterized protein n=1 Tax=Cutaneotrichosporon spelunceum TaxID=1672016 RepID=A0AAD3Y9W3_9TREE|nr:hypothetical protein CspeluHIS016_0109990 [Cutaneotrichosporon spelunceum]